MIIGEQYWLYSGFTKNTRVCQQGSPLPKAALKNWGNIIGELVTKLEERDIDLYYQIAPAKCTIYPEYTGDKLAPIADYNRYDQFIEYMTEQDIGVQFIDVRSSLIATKQDRQIYYRTDSHWNDYGAYISYRNVIGTIFPDLPEVEYVQLTDLKSRPSSMPTGSLATFLTVENNFQEEIVDFYFNSDTMVEIKDDAYIFINPNAPNDMTMLVFHDSYYYGSFTKISYSLISSHFHKTIFLNRLNGYNWNPESDEVMALLDEWQPDILLVERTERNLNSFALGDLFQGD